MCSGLGGAGMGELMGRGAPGVEDSGVKHAQAGEWQGWVPPREEGCRDENDSRFDGAHSWAVLGWVR